MIHLRTRLFAVVLILVCAALSYYNWHQLNTEGRYSIKLAAFTPVCIVGGLFIFLFPTKVGKPNTTPEKLIALGVFAVGLLAGLINWYLMDPGYFGF